MLTFVDLCFTCSFHVVIHVEKIVMPPSVCLLTNVRRKCTSAVNVGDRRKRLYVKTGKRSRPSYCAMMCVPKKLRKNNRYNFREISRESSIKVSTMERCPCIIHRFFAAVKIENLWKTFDISNIFAQNINNGTRQNHLADLCFRSKIRKMVYPFIPRFAI